MSLFRRDARPAPAVQHAPVVRYRELADEPPKAAARSSRKKTKAIIGGQVPIEISDRVDAMVEAGEFRSKSDFVLAAVRYYLEHLERKWR